MCLFVSSFTQKYDFIAKWFCNGDRQFRPRSPAIVENALCLTRSWQNWVATETYQKMQTNWNYYIFPHSPVADCWLLSLMMLFREVCRNISLSFISIERDASTKRTSDANDTNMLQLWLWWNPKKMIPIWRVFSNMYGWLSRIFHLIHNWFDFPRSQILAAFSSIYHV